MTATNDCAPVGWTGAALEHSRLGWRDPIVPLTEPLRSAARWWWRRKLYRLAPAPGERFEPRRSLRLDRALDRLEAVGGAP